MQRRRWRHKTQVFKEDGEWWWTCLRSGCMNGGHKAFITALRHALNHTFVGGYDTD